jgi:hypothetical protein
MAQFTSIFVLPVIVACLSNAVGVSVAFDPSTDPVFQKMVRVNAGLKSYTAHVDVETRVLFGRFTLHGTLYDWGSASKVVFDDVPGIAKSAVENQPAIEAPSAWPARYRIGIVSQTPDTTTYQLVPLDPGDRRTVDAVVQNDSGLVSEYIWSNVNGMTITSFQTYESVAGYQLVQSTITKTRGRGLRASSTTSFTEYALNGAIPGSVVSAGP